MAAEVWTRTFAFDLQEGDKVRGVDVGPEPRVVAERTHPPISSPAFKVTFDDGQTQSLYDFAPVEIHDPDGEVAERVRRRREQAQERIRQRKGE